MEQHPVPQNVTTFQFRLIGDMTIKQFGYLAGGAILGYISLKLPLPFFFTWPLSGLFFFAGIGFAFIPVEERPMDVWVLSFIKSIYSPTQFIWSKKGKAAEVSRVTNVAQVAQDTKAAPKPAPAAPAIPPSPAPPRFSWPHVISANVEEAGSWLQKHLKKTTPTLAGRVAQGSKAANVAKESPPAPSESGPAGGSASQTILTSPTSVQQTQGLETLVAQLQQQLAQKDLTAGKLAELQKELANLAEEKRRLEDELVAIKRKPIAPQPLPARTATPQTGQPTVKALDPTTAARAGILRLTTFPNVITGITKDPAGNLLPGILVTVRDKDDVPLRALKTNKLGQFGASTPLPPGVYIVEIEDPRSRYTFDRAQITVNDTVLPAIEIIAKSQKEIDRAKLAQQIFGGGNT